MPTKKQLKVREEIQEYVRQRDLMDLKINRIAEKHIPDFHFLDFKVSDFWPCDESPIGMCVFYRDHGAFHANCVCRYCGDPVERK